MTAAPIQRKLFPTTAVVAVALLFVACFSDEPTLEERAVALDRQLMCPVCPAETIDQSTVQVAKDMRLIVRQKLAAGETEQQIKDYFADPARYGSGVLASPPARGFALTVWIVPPVALVVALAVVALVIRDMRRRRRPVPYAGASSAAVTTPEEDLAPYLEAVDAERRATARQEKAGR